LTEPSVSFQTRLLHSSSAARSDVSAQASFQPLLSLIKTNCQRYPYLLASSAITQSNTQFDILLAFPQFTLRLDADKKLFKTTCLDGCDQDGGNDREELDGTDGFLAALDVLYQNEKKAVCQNPQNYPFTGGWFIYLAYEMAAEIEPCLSLPELPAGQPLAVASRCPAAVIVDKKNQQIIAIAESGYAYLLDEIEQDFRSLSDPSPSADCAAKQAIKLESLSEAETGPYLEQVESIKRYIIDGDIFQANLSRQWRARLKHEVADADLFYALAKQNPSSFAALACLDTMSIISSSPERLVSIRQGVVETRPIAGTRPRDENSTSDAALAKELLEHPKEQAEHIMLIDLERNDLGRVCRPGSIEVNELMALESWEHVHHIVSNVRGELLPDKTAIDVIRAVFPGGTITGCPKVRCMEILAEKEQQARGAYTGSLGYLNNDGSMDLNILIRTMVRDKSGATGEKVELTFRAGGGIVSDSIAENELAETRAKAKGLLKIFDPVTEDNESGQSRQGDG